MLTSRRRPADLSDDGQVLGQVGGGVPSDWEVEEVLTNIRVIAIGSQLTFSRQAQMFGVAGGGGGGGSSTVTLEVTSDQAKALIRATAGGPAQPEQSAADQAGAALLFPQGHAQDTSCQ